MLFTLLSAITGTIRVDYDQSAIAWGTGQLSGVLSSSVFFMITGIILLVLYFFDLNGLLMLAKVVSFHFFINEKELNNEVL